MQFRAIAFITLITVALAPGQARAQGYYNLDAGRPGRIEDATPTPRSELEVQLLPLRLERFASGARRWRTDSKASFGIAPFTEIEIRVPILVLDSRSSGVPITTGVGGIAFGGLHALRLETSAVPAVAVGGEWVAPVGSLAARVGSYSVKLLTTKTFAHARLHANVGIGTWSVRESPAAGPPCPTVLPPGTALPPGCGEIPPPVPDTPCDRIGATVRASCVAIDGRLLLPAVIEANATPAVGQRFVAALGADHAFSLSSTLITANVIAEQFVDLYEQTDLTAELGVRHQWKPQLVVDVGVTRHFTGVARSNAVTVGLTYDMPFQLRGSRRDEGR